MPYLSSWISALEAVVHVMRCDGCNRQEAIRQLEAAIFDRKLPSLRPGLSREWRRGDHLTEDDEVSRTKLLRLWPRPPAALGAPPPIFIEPREAVARVREALGCSGEDAVRFLCDRWIAGEITPRFTGRAPPSGIDPTLADWFTGAVILAGKSLPRRAIDEWNDDPDWQYVPGRSFPFLIDRQQLDGVMKATAAALDPPPAPIVPLSAAEKGAMQVRTGALPDDAIPFAEAMRLLSPIMGQHYPELEAKRALLEGAKDERLTAYGRPDRAPHYEALQASLWGWCEITPDGRDNYELRCNHKGIMSASRDIHFSRADVERFRDYLIASRAPVDPAAPMHNRGSEAKTDNPASPSPASPGHASMSVQAMRQAYGRLVREGKITTSTTTKARHQQVMSSAEVKAHIEKVGTDRGCSEDNFSRTVVNASWPGKPQIPGAKPQS